MKNLKNIVELIVAVLVIMGFLFGYFPFGTVIVTILCSAGLFIILCKDFWHFEADNRTKDLKSKDFIRYMTNTKKVLTLVFIILPIIFIFLNISRKYFPEKASHFIAYHFSQVDELTEIQTEKLNESKFESFSRSDTISCFKNVEFGSPKVAVKRKTNEHFFISCSFIIDESISYISNYAYSLFYWLSGLLVLLILGMLIIDKISLFFILNKDE